MTTATDFQQLKPQQARRTSKDPAHLPLHRRLLFPYHGLDATVPKLVDGDGEDIAKINERLYHLVALALRAYVLSWYTRISPRDRTLLPSINNTILTPLLQPILTSLHNDPSAILDLILLDLPTIVNLHLKTYREAYHQTTLDFGSLGDAYHARLPLLSVVKVGDRWELSPLYYTSMADGILKNGLSVEEYGSTAERLMARELLGRMVLLGVGKKLSEDWFWYSLLLKLLGEPRSDKTESEKEGKVLPTKRNITDLVSTWIVRIWSIVIMAWTAILTFTAFHSSAPKAEKRFHGCINPWISVLGTVIGHDDTRDQKPIIARLLIGILDCFAILASPIIDRTLPHFIQTRVLTPSTSLKLIDLIERILFPLDGYPAPTPPDPTSEEVIIMREKLEKRIDEMMPVRSVVLPGGAASLLDGLSSTECNAHLVAMVLDSIIAAVIPEMVIENR